MLIAWKLIITTLVIYAAYHFIDFKSLINNFSSITLPWIIVLLILATLDRIIMGVKWQHLINLLEIKVPIFETIKIYYKASFLSYSFPSSLTGDAYRSYAVNKVDPSLSKILSTIVVEKIIAILSSGLLACIGIAHISQKLVNTNLSSITWFIPAILFILIIVFYFSLSSSFIKTLLNKIPIKSIHKIANKLYSAYEIFSNFKLGLLANFFIAKVEHIIQYLIIYLCALAMQVDINVFELLGIIAIAQFIRKFAILIEGWALGEFIMVASCVAIGINQTDALAFSLLSHGIVLIASLPGAILLFYDNFSKKEANSIN